MPLITTENDMAAHRELIDRAIVRGQADGVKRFESALDLDSLPILVPPEFLDSPAANAYMQANIAGYEAALAQWERTKNLISSRAKDRRARWIGWAVLAAIGLAILALLTSCNHSTAGAVVPHKLFIDGRREACGLRLEEQPGPPEQLLKPQASSLKPDEKILRQYVREDGTTAPAVPHEDFAEGEL